MPNPHELQPQISAEGLTPNQEILAGMLFDTPTVAKVRRRFVDEVGGFQFTRIERPTFPVDFAQEGEFVLKIHDKTPDAPLSPIFINLRNLPSPLLEQFGTVMKELDQGDRPDFCTGIPEAGTPLGQAYGESTGVPFIEPMTKIEEGATRKLIPRGLIGNGESIRIIDDIGTGGDTKLEAAEIIERSGFRVHDISVLVDREQGARELIESKGHTFKAAFKITQLLQFGLRTERITQEQFDTIEEYLKSS